MRNLRVLGTRHRANRLDTVHRDAIATGHDGRRGGGRGRRGGRKLERVAAAATVETRGAVAIIELFTAGQHQRGRTGAIVIDGLFITSLRLQLVMIVVVGSVEHQHRRLFGYQLHRASSCDDTTAKAKHATILAHLIALCNGERRNLLARSDDIPRIGIGIVRQGGRGHYFDATAKG